MGEMIEQALKEGWGGTIIKTLVYDEKLYKNVQPRIHSVKGSDRIVAFSNFELGSAIPIES